MTCVRILITDRRMKSGDVCKLYSIRRWKRPANEYWLESVKPKESTSIPDSECTQIVTFDIKQDRMYSQIKLADRFHHLTGCAVGCCR